MSNKHDAEMFIRAIEDLKKQPWLGSRKWWADFIFHFSDVSNAARILEGGKLYSRNYLAQNGGMVTDNASPIVIQNTDDRSKEFVRFYFRPKTPTQFHNEGFRPIVDRTYGGAHCPVPVFFLFDSIPLLCMKDSMFTYGNLAANPEIYNAAEDFCRMPFRDIYHVGSFDRDFQSHIIFNRHAELLVPDQCSLEHLRHIICRSTAERETLLNLLPYKTSERWRSKITVNPHANLFYSDWAYIDEVTGSKTNVIFNFHVGPKVRNGYKAHFELIDHVTKQQQYWSDDNFVPTGTFTLKLASQTLSYTMKFYLDGQLAYSGSYFDDDLLPF